MKGGMFLMWKDIEGYEGRYQVSTEGEIKSVARHVENGSPNGMILPEKILKPFVTKSGYCQVTLRDGNGNREVLYVHRLVANNFFAIGFGETVNHIDGNKQNNNIDNLELVTYSENNQHAYNTGLRGHERATYTVLSESLIREIRERGKYDSYTKIAEEYGVPSPDVIANILKGKTYQDIK